MYNWHVPKIVHELHNKIVQKYVQFASHRFPIVVLKLHDICPAFFVWNDSYCHCHWSQAYFSAYCHCSQAYFSACTRQYFN